MAYNDDAVLAKLSALNESHDSIATAAQWIMFHRRHADRTVQLWLQRLKDSSSAKRLVLIYLANEVAQQTKARSKEDFVLAFSPVLAEACATAYKGATSDVQGKIRRVVEVWRARRIFEQPIQDAVEARLDEIDKTRSTARSGAFGGSIFGGSGGGQSIPSELRDLVTPQQNVSKQLLPVKSSLSTANAEYDKLSDPRNPLPAPPVYAAKLSGLLKHLATAENAVAESVKARKELVAALEKILDTNRAALEADEAQHKQLVARRAEIDSKRQEVELEIIRGMAPEEAPRDGPPLSPGGINDFSEPDRPEMEALTPPAAEDDDETLYDDSTISTGQQNGGGQQQVQTPVVQQAHPPMPHHQQQPSYPSAAPGIEMLSNIASQYQSVPVALNGSHKRRRVDSGEDFPDLGGEDIDAEVAEMLRRDSRGS